MVDVSVCMGGGARGLAFATAREGLVFLCGCPPASAAIGPQLLSVNAEYRQNIRLSAIRCAPVVPQQHAAAFVPQAPCGLDTPDRSSSRSAAAAAAAAAASAFNLTAHMAILIKLKPHHHPQAKEALKAKLKTDPNFRCAHGWMDGWMDGWLVGWMDGCMDGWMDGRGCPAGVVQ